MCGFAAVSGTARASQPVVPEHVGGPIYTTIVDPSTMAGADAVPFSVDYPSASYASDGVNWQAPRRSTPESWSASAGRKSW
jgi:hypothetical protein